MYFISCSHLDLQLGLAKVGLGRVRVEKKVGSGQGQKIRSTPGSEKWVIL